MTDHSLHAIYSRVLSSYKDVYVVPKIRFAFPATDYLYLLYSSFLMKESLIRIHSISAIGHFRFLVAQLLGKKPILHYHWLEFQDLKSLIGIIYKLKMIFFYKLLGGKLIWTIHNIIPHDKKWLGLHQKMHIWMADKADAILVHSKTIIPEVIDYYSAKSDKIYVVKHPEFPATIIDRENAIEHLNSKYGTNLSSNDLIIGSFGAISSYKGLHELVELLDQMDFKGKYLLFGYVKKGQVKLHKSLSDFAQKHDWFIYRPTFISEEDIPYLMSAFDYAVFNFSEISTSGGVEMALSYKRKIIAPAKGTLIDFIDDNQVQLFHSLNKLQSILKSIDKNFG